MALLNVNKQYSDGEILTEAQLDAAFDSIETFINVTGLTGDNIQDNSIGAPELQTSSVTESKLASNAVSTVKLQDGAVTRAKVAAALQAYLVPTGAIEAYAGDTAPTGWLICDGSPISRTTYADLFALVGVRFGQGDGTTTFRVPDLRGQFLRGRDAGKGEDPDVAIRTAMYTGGATGDNVGSLQSDEFAQHTHNLVYNGTATIGNQAFPRVVGSGSATGSALIDGGSVETRPTNVNVNFIIKT